jgi:hypothetical protein
MDSSFNINVKKLQKFRGLNELQTSDKALVESGVKTLIKLLFSPEFYGTRFGFCKVSCAGRSDPEKKHTYEIYPV